MAGIQSGLRPDRLLNMVSGKTWGWTAALSAALLFAVISAQPSFLHADETVAESAAGAPAGFSFENVVEQARGRAAKPFAPADKTLVEFLRKISRWQ